MHAMDLLALAWSEVDYTQQYVAMCKRVKALEDEVALLRGKNKPQRRKERQENQESV